MDLGNTVTFEIILIIKCFFYHLLFQNLSYGFVKIITYYKFIFIYKIIIHNDTVNKNNHSNLITLNASLDKRSFDSLNEFFL